MTMKIEYLPEGSPDCPLIRIYGNDLRSTQELHSAILRMAKGEQESEAIHRLPGFEPLGSCSLVILAADANEGVYENARKEFRWVLTHSRWKIVAGLVEPFTKFFEEHRHQWLCGGEARFGLDICSTSILLSNSASGEW